MEIIEPSTLEKAFQRASLIERIENENEDGLSVQGLQEFTIRLQEELQEEKEFTVGIQEKLREKEAKLAEHEKNKEREEKEVKELLQKLEEQEVKLAEHEKNKEMQKWEAEFAKKCRGCNTCKADLRGAKSRDLRCFRFTQSKTLLDE